MSTDTTRRTLLGRAALAAPAVALALPAAASPADPHEAWEAELVRLVNWYNDKESWDLPEPEREAVFGRIVALEDRLHLTEARTLAGVRAQLRNAVRDHERGGLSFAQLDGLAVTLAGLDALAAAGRA
jgi:hypothetical protein